MSYSLHKGNTADAYKTWEAPDLIICDGPYALGKTSQSLSKRFFKEDVQPVTNLKTWYEPHIKAWNDSRKNKTILLFFGSELSWAEVHPLLIKNQWQYVRCCIWNKGVAHIAGNINTSTINQFPCVTEVCVMYIPVPMVNGLLMKEWLKSEWKRSGLRLSDANVACGSKSAASRKYLAGDDQWYPPSPVMFQKLSEYANKYGAVDQKPYFNGWNRDEWMENTITFNLPVGVTNVWDYKSPAGKERLHPNQKPAGMIKMLLQTCSRENDVIWDCFAGSGVVGKCCLEMNRHCCGAEIDEKYW